LAAGVVGVCDPLPALAPGATSARDPILLSLVAGFDAGLGVATACSGALPVVSGLAVREDAFSESAVIGLASAGDAAADAADEDGCGAVGLAKSDRSVCF